MKHEFIGLTFGRAFVPLLPLRCSRCGLWARHRVAVQLEGLDCDRDGRR